MTHAIIPYAVLLKSLTLAASKRDIEAEIDSLRITMFQTLDEVRRHDKEIAVLWTPPWKRLLVWLDGWPLYRVVVVPKGRPWRRWWRS